MSSENVRILRVEVVQRSKLPVCGGLHLIVLELSHLAEDRHLLDKVLQALGVHRERVAIFRLLERLLLLFLQPFYPVVDNLLQLGSRKVAE
jgi:hypothetical protein